MYFQVNLLAQAYSYPVTDTFALTYSMHQYYLMQWHILEVNTYYLFESHPVSSERESKWQNIIKPYTPSRGKTTNALILTTTDD